jgi:predicted nuclease of predicted toxin-antitoxin system
MKILAGENLARDIIAWLRASGHDVLYAADAAPGTSDSVWAVRAEQEDRILLTADKDFGELVFRDGLSSHGVVLLRLDDLTVSEALSRLQSVWSVVEANPTGQFIVITEKKVRVRPLTSAIDDADEQA